MSSRHPATVRLSLEELSRHGGLVGPHQGGCADGTLRCFDPSSPGSHR